MIAFHRSEKGCMSRHVLTGGLLLCLLAGAGEALRAQEGRIPYDLQVLLEEPLNARVKELLAARNSEGDHYKRGRFSKHFRKVDEGTYQVTFMEDTAHPDSMLTDRYLLTLRRDAAGRNWTVAESKLEDSVEVLSRTVLGDETFERFAGFQLQEEGMTIKATNGTLVKDYLQGEPVLLALAADDLSYVFTPPDPADAAVLEIAKEDHGKYLVFTPENVVINCAPRTCQELLEKNFTELKSSSRDQLHPKLEKYYAKRLREIDNSRKSDPFSGFRRPYEDAREVYAIAINKDGADHRVYLVKDSYSPREVAFGVAGLGRLFAYYSEETRLRGAPPAELERRPDPDSRDYDLRSVKGEVELALEASEKLAGDVTFGLKLLRDVPGIHFQIARLSGTRDSSREAKNPRMVVNGLQDGEGNDLTWIKTGAVSGYIPFSGGRAAGTELTVRMQFENTDAIYKLTPSYSYVDRGGWLPFVRYGDMIDQFDLTMKVPAKYKAIGIGQQVEERKEKDYSVTRWVADFPVNFPTVTYGNYLEAKPGFEAKTSEGKAIPVVLHMDRSSMAKTMYFCNGSRAGCEQGINVVEWKITPKLLKPLSEDAANALNLYREVFGVDYPFAKLDLVNDPGLEGAPLYGQSPASLVYLGNLAFMGEGMLGNLASSKQTLFVKSLVAHEVGHQWWGSLVANANTRNYWFIESLAEYAASLFIESKRGPKKYAEHVKDWRRIVLDADMYTCVQDATTLWGSRYHQPAVYAKGPYTFHMLRSMYGDEKFFAFLRQLTADLKGREIVTRDIQEVAERVFAQSLEPFFDQWIRGVGIPEYTVTYDAARAEDGGHLVRGKIEQKVYLGIKKHLLPDTYYVAVTNLAFQGADGNTYRKPVVISGPETVFAAKLPVEPKKVSMNDDGEILAYDVIYASAR